jgi:hypothetical protein
MRKIQTLLFLPDLPEACSHYVAVCHQRQRHWHRTIEIGARSRRADVNSSPLHATLYVPDRLPCITRLYNIPVGLEPMATVASWTSWASFPRKYR